MPPLDKPLAAFERALGSDYVLTDPQTLASAETATYATTQRIAAILRPACVADVQACVRIAAEYGVALYPISRGTNWGYGSRVPVKTGSMVLDLSRLDQIEDFNEDLGYFSVQPGVTFRKAFRFLRERSSKLLLCAIGGSPDSSLIGNVVERGIGKGPYGDRFAHVCNLEVVTGTGSLIKTGMGRFAAKTAPVYRWGLGPSLDGLFTQSSLGIVTGMTQWLMPRPEFFQILFYKVEHENQLPSILDTLRTLLLNGTLKPTLTLYNDYRLMASVAAYPFERTAGKTPLPEDVRTALRAELGGSVWGGDIAIYSPSVEHGRAVRNLVNKALAGNVTITSEVEADGEEIDAILALGESDGEALDAGTPNGLRRGLLKNFLGIPDNAAVRSVYWRKPRIPERNWDPDRDRCGLLWYAPVVPFQGDAIVKALGMMESCLRKYDFEPGLTIQCMAERWVYAVASISYDRDTPGDDERAIHCYHEMAESLTRAGFPPYRLANLSMSSEGSTTSMDPYEQFLHSLRQTLDPADIVAPGRYR